MSKGYWRTAKQSEPFNPGDCATSRVAEYTRLWQNRCYGEGIPDEVPAKVAESGRAPSWKAVAMCLLRNDLHLYRLGFAKPCYERQLLVADTVYEWMHGTKPEYTQLRLFNDDISGGGAGH